jgi:hypothetical protein
MNYQSVAAQSLCMKYTHRFDIFNNQFILTLTNALGGAKIATIMLELDQSNKIERLERDTILALSNQRHYAIRIPSSVKRELFTRLQSKGKSRKNAYLWIFSAGVFLLLKPHLSRIIKQQEVIVIDVEYTGQDANIKSMITRYCRRAGFELQADNIRFARIGKSSGAHKVAHAVQAGKAKVNKRITTEDFLELM